MKTIAQIVREVANKYQQAIAQHSRDDIAMTQLIETAIAEGIAIALNQHLETHPYRNLASAG